MKSSKYINPKSPLVSFLTPTFNRPDWLRLTLQYLTRQTYPFIEILIINDAGIDVQDVVDEFHDSRIKYFVNEKNSDLAFCRNVALEKSSGDYYIMCDDDDFLYEDAVEFRLSMIKKYKAEVFYTHALKMYYQKFPEGYQLKGSSLYWHSENIKDLLLVQNLAPCNCYIWSRKAQEKAGLFDISLKCSEDWAHTVEMRQHFGFYGTNIIDCACSWRDDASQMTGSRTGFTDHLPYLFGKWRKYAENVAWVTEHQNSALKARGLNPADYGL
jgi:O-antigen biosynthesis protein